MKNKNVYYIIISVITIILLITIYFKFDNYTITYVVDNEIYEEVKIKKNTYIKEIIKPEKEGYAFIGWYDENNNLLESNTIIKQNSVYYAKWANILTEEE